MPLGIQDIWKVPQNVAATERAREAGQRADITTKMNVATQQYNLDTAKANAEIETQQKKAEIAYSKLNFANRMLSTVKDDATLARAKEQYLSIYPEDKDNVDKVMPGKYKKSIVDQAKLELRSMADTLKPLTVREGEKIVDPATFETLVTGGKKTEKIDQFSEPYVDKTTGALMQKNLKTGKINKISTPPKGMVIESDGAGGFTMRTGVPSGSMVAKTKGTIEGKILGGKEAVARIEKIYNDFKPEYQEIGTRLSNEWTSLKAKAGIGVSEDEKTELTGYKSFQRKAIENINLYIKEITGAQMSEREADRLRLAQPDPGEKWYQGDDPITFKSKMEDVLKMSEAAINRYESYRNQGLSPVEIQGIVKSDSAKPLDEFVPNEKTIQERGDELAAQGKQKPEIMTILKSEGYF